MKQQILAVFVVVCCMVQGTLQCEASSRDRTGAKLCDSPVLVLPLTGECNTNTPKNINDVPEKISFSGAETEKTYILVMLDPDAPSADNPTSADWTHWIVADVPGDALLLDGTFSSSVGKTLVSYHKPSPPEDSGYHRYQLFLFASPDGTTGRDIVGYDENNRAKFSLKDFVEKNNLCDNLVATYQMRYKYQKIRNRLLS